MCHNPALELSYSKMESLLRTLPEPSPVQMCYVQIEKELLAVVFAFTKFYQYVYSQDFIVESDHKPLEAILKKSLAAVPLRLQRMILQLQSIHLHFTTNQAKKWY